jgi:hypothetical protein
MAFTEEPIKTPTEIPYIRVILEDNTQIDSDTGQPIGQSADFELVILDQDNEVIGQRSGALQNHITGPEAQWLSDLMTELRTLAETELLPTPAP